MPSVLDLLLHKIYKGARDTQWVVLLSHGMLLSAYYNRTILPRTEDVDLVDRVDKDKMTLWVEVK